MNRTLVAVVVAATAIAALLGGAYGLFFVLAGHIPPGRILGMFSAALMVGSGLGCAGVVYAANKWIQSSTAKNVE